MMFAIVAFIIFGIMAIAGYIDMRGLSVFKWHGRCDWCGKEAPLRSGPYDDCMCQQCYVGFDPKEYEESDYNV